MDELGGALGCARVVEHSFELSLQAVVLEELAVLGRLEQLSIGRRTPNDVAHAGGQLVLAHRPGGAVAALVLDAIEEAGRLQHRLDQQRESLLERPPGGSHRGGNPAKRRHLVLLERRAQKPFAHLGHEIAHDVVGESSFPGEAFGELPHVHFADDDAGKPRVGLDVLEIDGEIVGGVAEAVGPNVRRQGFPRLLRDVHAGQAPHGLNVLRHREAAHPVLVDAPVVRVGQWVDFLAGPNGTVVDPLSQQFLFVYAQRITLVRHVVRLDDLPQQALRRLAGNDHDLLFRGGERGRFF